MTSKLKLPMKVFYDKQMAVELLTALRYQWTGDIETDRVVTDKLVTIADEVGVPYHLLKTVVKSQNIKAVTELFKRFNIDFIWAYNLYRARKEDDQGRVR